MGNEKAKETDYLALAQVVDDQREIVRAMVAGFMGDGFTDEQARAIVAGIFAVMLKGGDSDAQGT